MAKELTAADVAAFLASKGMGVPEELTTAIENEKEDAAFHAVTKVLSDEVDAKDAATVATKLQKDLFDLAENLSAMTKSERNNVGRGQADQHKITVETHYGTLFVRLSSVVESDKK